LSIVNKLAIHQATCLLFICMFRISFWVQV